MCGARPGDFSGTASTSGLAGGKLAAVSKSLRVLLQPSQDLVQLAYMLDLRFGVVPLKCAYEYDHMWTSVRQVCNCAEKAHVQLAQGVVAEGLRVGVLHLHVFDGAEVLRIVDKSPWRGHPGSGGYRS